MLPQDIPEAKRRSAYTDLGGSGRSRPDAPARRRPGTRPPPTQRGAAVLSSPSESHGGGSSNGRTADSDSASLGSNPSPPANLFSDLRAVAAERPPPSNPQVTPGAKITPNQGCRQPAQSPAPMDSMDRSIECVRETDHPPCDHHQLNYDGEGGSPRGGLNQVVA